MQGGCRDFGSGLLKYTSLFRGPPDDPLGILSQCRGHVGPDYRPCYCCDPGSSR